MGPLLLVLLLSTSFLGTQANYFGRGLQLQQSQPTSTPIFTGFIFPTSPSPQTTEVATTSGSPIIVTTTTEPQITATTTAEPQTTSGTTTAGPQTTSGSTAAPQTTSGSTAAPQTTSGSTTAAPQTTAAPTTTASGHPTQVKIITGPTGTVVVGEPILFLIQVETTGLFLPIGTVTITGCSIPLPVIAGFALLTTSFDVAGSQTVTISFDGVNGFGDSSISETIQVQPAQTDTYLSAVPFSLLGIHTNTPVVFTAVVHAERPSQSIPDGTVKFTRSANDPNPVIVPLVNGVATTTYSWTASTRATVRAVYQPSPNYGSSSDSLTAVIV